MKVAAALKNQWEENLFTCRMYLELSEVVDLWAEVPPPPPPIVDDDCILRTSFQLYKPVSHKSVGSWYDLVIMLWWWWIWWCCSTSSTTLILIPTFQITKKKSMLQWILSFFFFQHFFIWLFFLQFQFNFMVLLLFCSATFQIRIKNVKKKETLLGKRKAQPRKPRICKQKQASQRGPTNNSVKTNADFAEPFSSEIIIFYFLLRFFFDFSNTKPPDLNCLFSARASKARRSMELSYLSDKSGSRSPISGAVGILYLAISALWFSTWILPVSLFSFT